jgi:vacuolar-type H+-ATPase subunit E/Vma4
MARGWESKSVESQIESAERRREESDAAALDADQIRRLREKESLQSSRTRVLNDLAACMNPRYREKLLAALSHLDEKLEEMERNESR